ncbi:hypothetical protein [Aggregatibacter actinomycetemcomitans]|uniref:hypothetical protein n=1 Tax=Aggregatibacter actinomycetemcomitans TaxID=714 RepID=UPI00022BFCA2|nr:hypothetical protein [Aggregatibacter actinomycetemcomitans]KOE31981.1 hypothetical protein D17P3_0301475 [Aggregatibacter actinomycetemcomitans D17P-3]KOE61960.1 hypothetical protein D17P2_0305335 [Aggregatibacter actinomycetemcomitans serotype c str. D17P-2]
MDEYQYRYALAEEHITENDDGLLWQDESRYLPTVAEHIAQENLYGCQIREEDWSQIVWVWKDGEFENRQAFLIRAKLILRFDAQQL